LSSGTNQHNKPKGVENEMSRIFKVLLGLAALAATAGAPWIIIKPGP